jgi:hypothetical protein
MKRFFILLAVIVSVPLALKAQQVRDPTQQVFIGDKLMSYDAALPLATKMLDGSVEEQKQAVSALEEFGISLKSTPALEKLLVLVEKQDDFSAFDNAAKTSPDSKAFFESPVGKPLADLFEIKSTALSAVVMAGSDKGEHLLQSYLTSKSLAYRLMAKDANEARLRDGTWNKGKQTTNKQPKLFAYNGHGMLQDDYVRAIRQALESNETDKLHLAITSLFAAGNASAIKDTDIFDRLFAIFVQTASNPSEADRKIRLSIIRIINRSGDKRTSEFMKVAADDKDEIVRDEARGLLE